jgi:hypothetical protein
LTALFAHLAPARLRAIFCWQQFSGRRPVSDLFATWHVALFLALSLSIATLVAADDGGASASFPLAVSYI